jgi:CubicO group peptidase (beta-lactamase class C family)
MQSSYQKGVFNGNVLITRNDSILYQKSFGYTDGSEKNELSKKSIFCIGSAAKEFFAVSIMMLIERGELRMDDKLSKFGLELPTWSEKVTIKHLLNYTSGLPIIDYETAENEQDMLEDLKQLPNLLFEPGTDFNYNNNSIFLQKKIIEFITNKTFQDFMKENIIFPLKMKDAVFDPNFNYPNRTRCFNEDKKNSLEIDPSKGWLWVSIDDLNKWISALHSYELISEASLKTILRNQYFKDYPAILGSTDELFLTHIHGGQFYQFETRFISEFDNDLNIILMSNNKNQVREIVQSLYNKMKN